MFEEKKGHKKTQRKRAALPSLQENYHPGWAVHKHKHIASMTEIGTGRSYDIPKSRFNKAALYLRLKHVNDGLQAKMNGLDSQGVCRCERGCASGTDPDFVLSCREWYYIWHCHDEAVSELARVMAKNNRDHGEFYIIRGKQVQCTVSVL